MSTLISQEENRVLSTPAPEPSAGEASSSAANDAVDVATTEQTAQASDPLATYTALACGIARQCCKLIVEPDSAVELVDAMKACAVCQISDRILLVHFDSNLWGISRSYEVKRKVPLNQVMVSKLLQAALAVKNSASNDECGTIAVNTMFAFIDGGFTKRQTLFRKIVKPPNK